MRNNDVCRGETAAAVTVPRTWRLKRSLINVRIDDSRNANIIILYASSWIGLAAIYKYIFIYYNNIYVYIGTFL